VYGAAGSFAIVLVWTYYSSQILFFGAELIRAYAKYFDPVPVVPTEQALPIADVTIGKRPAAAGLAVATSCKA
jgi:membrane protein